MRTRPIRSATTLLSACVALGGAAIAAPAGAATAGAVACAAPAAADAGAAVLAAGGNAADAAVATALALAVVHPQAGNLGGGGFAVVRFGEKVAALDFREVAPAAAHRAMFLSPAGEPIPESSLVGPLAAGVPGSPAGLFELHRRFGRLPWRRVVAPAERLARDGFVVSERLARELAAEHVLLARFAETAAVWLPNGEPPPAGAIMRLPALAATLARYARYGPKALTTGRLAAAIEAASRRHGGVLTAADLAAYRPVWRAPLRFAAFGWEITSMPLPSAGGLVIAESCGMLERLGWAALPRGGAERTHVLVETWRRAFADRFLLGDPGASLASARELLDPAWLDRRAASIDRRTATASTAVQPWSPPAESPETTHLSVIDAGGNAVALTTTLNESFGCGLLVPEAGFLLNNEMDDFTTAPGRPNRYRLTQGEANAVAPGKRMLSSMTPTIARRDGELLVLGSPGGSHIPTATLQVLLAVITGGDDLETAVGRPRLHHQWLPDEIVYEAGALATEVASELAARGHVLRQTRKLGEVHAVERCADGRVIAVADPRGPGAVAPAAPAASAAPRVRLP